MFLCVAVVCVLDLLLGVTEYYTVYAYSTVQDCGDFCRTGADDYVIFQDTNSFLLQFYAIAVSTFISSIFAMMYRIAVAALGMLSTIASELAIDPYGPISKLATMPEALL